MSLVEGNFVARHTASTLGRIAVLAVAALVVEACGDDHEDTGSAVAAACASSCNATSGRCNVANLAPGCSVLCDLGYSLVPACGAAYQTYVNCTGASPLVSCNGNTVTVSVTVPPCLDQLGSYLDCAVKQALSGCVELPLENAACVDAKLGNRATACLRAPAGCALLTGTVQAGGLGVFCCP